MRLAMQEQVSWIHTIQRYDTRSASLKIMACQLSIINAIEHSDPEIAMNFNSLYLEVFCVYWFETLQDHLQIQPK